MPAEIRIETRRTEVAAIQWGDPSAFPVLAVHGWLENAHTWLPLAPFLEGLNLVAIDLPGHGLSEPRPVPGAYHYVEWVADIIAVADALGWEQFGLMGHSMGGGISALSAGAFPERVRALVSVEGLYPTTGAPSDAPETVQKAVAGLIRAPQRARRTYQSIDEAIESRLFKPPHLLSFEAARLVAKRSLEAVDGGFVYRHDRRHEVSSFVRLTIEQVLAFYARIACPTLVIRGTSGFNPEPENADNMIAALHEGRVVQVDGGHWVHMDDAAAVGPMVRKFLLDTSWPDDTPDRT